MTITRTFLRSDQDGTPMYHYRADGHVVLTGSIQGTVTLPDGTEVDVTDAAIEVDSLAKAQLVADAIAARHAAEGDPDFSTEPHDFAKE